MIFNCASIIFLQWIIVFKSHGRFWDELFSNKETLAQASQSFTHFKGDHDQALVNPKP